MDLKNITTILKKINRLYELINDIGEASRTEKDLLKAYVLDLYEAVALSDEGEIIDLDQRKMFKKIKKQKKAEKKIRKQLGKDDHEDVSLRESVSENAIDKNITSEILEEVEVTTPEIADEVNIPPELIELFETSEIADLSDKLGQKAIPDLTRAMGINDKILTMNELFGGNKEEFDSTLSTLNGLNNFEEAKEILIRNAASKYEWHKEKSNKKAKNFIKLVQKRYN